MIRILLVDDDDLSRAPSTGCSNVPVQRAAPEMGARPSSRYKTDKADLVITI
jgi:hypothetical protein